MLSELDRLGTVGAVARQLHLSAPGVSMQLSTLEREVALTIVDSEHPNRAGVLDAARRAAGVEDARLVRILDVGNQEGSSFIVEEAMSGSESLAVILLQGPLPAEEARRIAGETARGLETASQRGLHHLRLTPHCILIAPDGAIRVSGVAVAAAIDYPDKQEPDPDTASRRDAVCCVAVAYAALTSRWPLDEQVSGIEPAPRVVDGVAAPSEIAAGVPADLDELCQATLNEGAGPATPGEFANQIAPWSRERVHGEGADPTTVLQTPRWDDVTQAVAMGPIGAQQTVALSSPNLATPGPATQNPAARADGYPDSELSTPPTLLLGESDDVAPPLPLLPASTALPPSRTQSKVAVLLVAAFVSLSLLVGYCGLRGPSSGTGTATGTKLSTSKQTAAVTTPAAAAPSSPEPTNSTTAGASIAILSATGFDPEGDQIEKNSQVPRVYDGNPATVWTSEGYNSETFGGLKTGVGVILDLGQPTSVHEVTLDLGSGPVDVTAYAATGTSTAGATVIGAATGASGRVQLKAASTMPQAQYVIIWFTKVAPDGGKFRASIAEIALS